MFSRWTLRLCTVLGIPVRAHLLLPAVVVLSVVTTPEYTRKDVLYGLLTFFGVMLLTVLLHELGHALVARGRRLRVHGILLWPLGGLTSHDEARLPGDRVRVALAGLGMNVLLAFIAGLGMLIRDGSTPALPSLAVSTDFLQTAWSLNLAVLLLNLLPGVPFDGGAALEGMLWNRLGRPRARLVVLGTGAIAGLGLLFAGFVNGQILLAAVGGWALYEVARGYEEIRSRGLEDEALLGVYDFSEGYTSLQAGAPPVDREERRRETAREGKMAPLEDEGRAAEPAEPRETPKQRLDGLLDRIAADGIDSLTDEERAFLEEESRRLRALRRGKSTTRP